MTIELNTYPFDGQIDSYLIQRLTEKPRSEFSATVSRVFNGPLMLKEEGWKEIQKVFDLDYMGAAEYEFGIIPKTLKSIAENVDKYEGFTFVLETKYIKEGYWRTDIINSLRHEEIRLAKEKGEKPPRKSSKKLAEKAKVRVLTDATVFVFGPKGARNRDLMIDFIKRAAQNKVEVKRGHRFDSALDPDPRYGNKVKGWLDLKNKFFWFIDEEMYRGTLALFGKEE